MYGEWIWGDNLGRLIGGAMIVGQVSGWQEIEKTMNTRETPEVEPAAFDNWLCGWGIVRYQG